MYSPLKIEQERAEEIQASEEVIQLLLKEEEALRKDVEEDEKLAKQLQQEELKTVSYYSILIQLTVSSITQLFSKMRILKHALPYYT